MARTITHTGGGPFLGNPITFSLPALSLAGNKEIDLAKVAFHRVVMLVTIGGVTHEFSKTVSREPAQGEGSVIVEFDISSAFKSAAESQQYAPVTSSRVEYDIYRATIHAHDVWVYDGRIVDGQGEATPETFDAIAGAYSDYERMQQHQTATPSRKPSSGELVMAGDTYVSGKLFDGMDLQPCSELRTMSAANAGKHITIGGRNIYVLGANAVSKQDTMLFQFVNSRGVVESVRSFHLPKEQEDVETQTIVRSVPETFREFSRRVVRKNQPVTSLSLSSGYVTREWARWWMDEFCMSDRHWMLTDDGIWLPCSIKPDNKSSLTDRTKSELCCVQFTATPDISGAIVL